MPDLCADGPLPAITNNLNKCCIYFKDQLPYISSGPYIWWQVLLPPHKFMHLPVVITSHREVTSEVQSLHISYYFTLFSYKIYPKASVKGMCVLNTVK